MKLHAALVAGEDNIAFGDDFYMLASPVLGQPQTTAHAISRPRRVDSLRFLISVYVFLAGRLCGKG